MTGKAAIPWALGSILCVGATPGLWAIQGIDRVACDGSPCPRPLELEEGEPVTIAMTGQGLEALVSGEVTDRRGRPVRGVTVELDPPGRSSRTRGGATRRGVTVTARGVGALAGLELRFTTNARGSVTAPLDLSVAAAPTREPARFEARTPLRVEVAAGQKATIEIGGSGLDRPLTDLRIESGGRLVSGVTAAVVGASEETLMLEVAVDRLASLSSGGPYELVAYDGANRLSVMLDLLTPPSEPDPVTRTATAHLLIATPPVRMTGLRFPIQVEATGLRMTGLRFPIRVGTQELRMTGIREEEP